MVPARRQPLPEPPPCRIRKQPKAGINQGQQQGRYKYLVRKVERFEVRVTRDIVAFGETLLLVLFLSLRSMQKYIERLRREAQENIIACYLFETTRDAAYRTSVMALAAFCAINALHQNQGTERLATRCIDQDQESPSGKSSSRYIEEAKSGSTSEGNPRKGGEEYSMKMSVWERHVQRVLKHRSARKKQGRKTNNDVGAADSGRVSLEALSLPCAVLG